MGQPYTLDIKCLGGGLEVGNSCTVLSIGTKHVLFDIGLKRNQFYWLNLESLSNLNILNKNLDIYLSHYHLDHIGGITLILTHTILEAFICSSFSTKLLFYYNYKYFLNFLSLTSVMFICNDDLDITLELTASICEDIKLIKSSINSFVFKKSGHSLGSAMIHWLGIEFYILYTGDYCYSNTMLLQEENLLFKTLDLVVIETTMGIMNYVDSIKNRRYLIKYFIMFATTQVKNLIFPVISHTNLLTIMIILIDFLVASPRYYSDFRILFLNNNSSISKTICGKLNNSFKIYYKKKSTPHLNLLSNTKDLNIDNYFMLDNGKNIIFTNPNIITNRKDRISFSVINRKNTVLFLTELYNSISLSGILRTKPKFLNNSTFKNKRIYFSIKDFYTYSHPARYNTINSINLWQPKVFFITHVYRVKGFELITKIKLFRRLLRNVHYILLPETDFHEKYILNSQQRILIYNTVLKQNSIDRLNNLFINITILREYNSFFHFPRKKEINRYNSENEERTNYTNDRQIRLRMFFFSKISFIELYYIVIKHLLILILSINNNNNGLH